MIAINMDIPNGCNECRFNTEYQFCSAKQKSFDGNTYGFDNFRPLWCPLKKVDMLKCGTMLSEYDIQYKRKAIIYCILERVKDKILECFKNNTGYIVWDSKKVQFSELGYNNTEVSALIGIVKFEEKDINKRCSLNLENIIGGENNE